MALPAPAVGTETTIETFTVTLRPSGRSFSCAPQSDLLKAGLASGVSMRFSCRSGVCRTCRGKVVQGQVDVGVVHPAYLSDADKAQGYAHLCCAKPLSDCVIEVDEIPAGLRPAITLPARVMKLERMAPDVMQLVLGFPPNEPQYFSAGQSLQILAAEGVTRSYSIASAPSAEGLRQLELHIRHMPGGAFTDRVFASIKVRDLLRVETPHGLFGLDESSSKPIVMIASGTGFAPIKAMVEHGLRQGFKRPLHVYWGGRKRDDIYMHALALQWSAEHAHIRYTPVLSEPSLACAWEGRHGFVHQAVVDDYPSLADHQVYACGAPVMVEAARRDLTGRCGLPQDQFFADSFVSEADKARTVTATAAT